MRKADSSAFEMMMHDLRSPLHLLLLQLDNLAFGVDGGATSFPADWVESKVESMRTTLLRAVGLMENALDTSRTEESADAPTLEDGNLAEIGRVIADDMRALAKQSGSTLIYYAEPQIQGRWNKHGVQRVVTNLLSNAIKYGRGKPIQLELTADAERARIVVRDHGIGIPPEDQVRVFERFERAAAQRADSFGLGLWIVRKLITAMGGTISLASTPGSGSTFTVELPRRAARSRPQAPARMSARSPMRARPHSRNHAGIWGSTS
jgi:signal transduction histidine kinase